jgi:hypothetical protein
MKMGVLEETSVTYDGERNANKIVVEKLQDTTPLKRQLSDGRLILKQISERKKERENPCKNVNKTRFLRIGLNILFFSIQR